jgi:hypothetical protein
MFASRSRGRRTSSGSLADVGREARRLNEWTNKPEKSRAWLEMESLKRCRVGRTAAALKKQNDRQVTRGDCASAWRNKYRCVRAREG